MISRLRRLQARREALVARSAAQRAHITAALAPAVRKLATADRLVATLRAHPMVTGAAAAGLILIGPHNVLRWTLRLAPFYSLLRSL